MNAPIHTPAIPTDAVIVAVEPAELPGIESRSPEWDPARALLAGVHTTVRQSVAGWVFLGRELAKLKEDLGFVGAGRRIPARAGIKSWPDYTRSELGLSDDMADRCIAAYKVIQHRGKALLSDDSEEFRVLIAPPATLSENEQKRLQDAVGSLLTYHAASDAADRLNGIREKSKEAIDAEISSLESLNRIQNADDSAYKAQRDREDAAAIRGGAAPEDVKSKRARDDAAMELRKIDREEGIARAGLRDASNAAIGAEGNLNIIKQSPNATPEQIAEAQKTADELKERLRVMEQKAEEQRRINSSRRREVRDRAQGRIEGYQADKDDRLQREADQQAARAKRDADDKASREDAARRKAETDASKRDREAAGIGREAVGILPKGVSEKFRAAVEAASAGLQDGDQGGELERLAGYIEKLAASAQRNKAVSEAQRIKIAQLEKRISQL